MISSDKLHIYFGSNSNIDNIFENYVVSEYKEVYTRNSNIFLYINVNLNVWEE